MGGGWLDGDAHRDIVVLGASAGGVEALRVVVSGLPALIGAALFVVLHLPRQGPQALPAILSRAGPVPAVGACDGAPARIGMIHVAPPGFHLLLAAGDTMRLSEGTPTDLYRPSVDALFTSAARWYGDRVIAVVLSGAGRDGSAGLAAVVAAGGLAVIQDPDEAQYSSMPAHALARVPGATVRPVAVIGAKLGRLTGRPILPVPGADN